MAFTLLSTGPVLAGVSTALLSVLPPSLLTSLTLASYGSLPWSLHFSHADAPWSLRYASRAPPKRNFALAVLSAWDTRPPDWFTLSRSLQVFKQISLPQ